MSELIFLDLEWNTAFCYNRKGERVPFHELLEIAAIKVEQDTGAMLDSFHSYIRPKASRKIGFHTYDVLPYSPEELDGLLSDAPCFLDLGPDFLHWCGPSPVFIEWGNNDVEVLLSNFKFHNLSFDTGWKCEYFDLQYIYQQLCTGDRGCQPSLEKAVTDLELDTDLDFHSAWNDTYYTIMVYQTMMDRCAEFSLFRRPPKHKGPVPLWELDLGIFDGRWTCKNHQAVLNILCPTCGQPLNSSRWIRTTPTEHVLRCYCPEHGRLYFALTVEEELDHRWHAQLACYKDAGQIAERYHKTCHRLKMRNKRRERSNCSQSTA